MVTANHETLEQRDRVRWASGGQRSPRAAWVADPGSYTVAIGASSRDIRQRVSCDVPEERIIQQVENRLTPEEPIAELTPPGM
jgi:hypothetical protein